MKTATEFCQLVERRLGWLPPEGKGYRTYQAEAAKVLKRMASNPDLFTFHNLELAVQLLVEEKTERTPIGVFSHVERALSVAREEENDVELLIQSAVAYERGRGDPQGWETRFARTTGAYRGAALQEWKESI